MKLKTFDFQKRAIKELFNYLKFNIQNNKQEQTFLLQAPTGSGKTIIMSQFVNNLKENLREDGLNKDFSYIWLSIGDGGLEAQSQDKFNKYASSIKTLSFEDLINNKELNKNEIAFINWEKIVNKSNKHGIESEGDKTNIKDVLFNTQVPIILMIDESHRSSHTKKAEKIKSFVSPFLTVNMTATPLKNMDYDYRVEISEKEVAEVGVIKKETLVNPIRESKEKKYGVRKTLLEEAIYKRRELKELYEDQGSNVNPLCIIQLENNNKKLKEDIIDILNLNGISTVNNRLAIWLSNEKVNKENLEELDNKVDFLIFKQAVATGWDCPRSQILVKFRTTKSESFEKQVIGRIFRMPELKFYPYEALNKAYIYTDDNEFLIKAQDTEFKVKETIESKLNYPKALDVKIPSEKVIKEKVRHDQDSLTSILIEKLKNKYKGIDLMWMATAYNKKQLEDSSLIDFNLGEDINTEVVSGGFDSVDQDETLDYSEKRNDLALSSDNIYYNYLNMLKEVDQNAKSSIKLLYENQYCKNYLDLDPNNIEDLEKIKKMYILNHKKYFKPLFTEIIKEYKNKYKRNQKVFKTTFEFPAKEKYDKDNKTIEEPEKYLYDKYIYNKNNMYKTETSFEKFLGENEKVIWWYKNKDQAEEAFSIVYELKEVKFNHYPDYIIKTDKGIGIFEVKHEDDDSLASKEKAIALKNYIKANIEVFYTNNHLHLFGGQVRELADTGSWKVFVGDEESFSEEITEECWKGIETIL